MLNYIIISPLGEMSSNDRCTSINRELWKISRPLNYENDCSLYLFDQIKHPDQDMWALVVDLDCEITVDPYKNLTVLITLLDSNLTIEQIRRLIDYIDSSQQVLFRNILPPTVIVRDEQYMKDNGWIKEVII